MKKIKLVAVICCILCIYILAENAGNYYGNDTNACSEAFNVNVYEPESYYMMKGSIPGNMLGGGYKRIAASFGREGGYLFLFIVTHSVITAIKTKQN